MSSRQATRQANCILRRQMVWFMPISVIRVPKIGGGGPRVLKVFSIHLGYIYGPKAAGREKSALNVTKTSSLGELPRPNRLCYQLVLLDSWKTLGGAPAHQFSPSWDHF